MMTGAASDFMPASDLPASPSREEQLEALIKTQAAALERYEAMLDSQPQQQAGGRMGSQEKAAIIAALSKLDDRITNLEQATKDLDDLKKDLKEAGEKIHEVHELARYALKTLSVRCTNLEDLHKPKETATNQAHLQAIWEELLCRQKAGTRGITYREAAKLCRVEKSTIKKLHSLIAADLRFDVIWHPKKKNTKLICLKNYK
ncbi:MAG TPA: hypothetical protein PLD96_08225 [Methanothrix sp.]|nr:hypothetical protein [Methanothrix sp.]